MLKIINSQILKQVWTMIKIDQDYELESLHSISQWN